MSKVIDYIFLYLVL